MLQLNFTAETPVESSLVPNKQQQNFEALTANELEKGDEASIEKTAPHKKSTNEESSFAKKLEKKLKEHDESSTVAEEEIEPAYLGEMLEEAESLVLDFFDLVIDQLDEQDFSADKLGTKETKEKLVKLLVEVSNQEDIPITQENLEVLAVKVANILNNNEEQLNAQTKAILTKNELGFISIQNVKEPKNIEDTEAIQETKDLKDSKTPNPTNQKKEQGIKQDAKLAIKTNLTEGMSHTEPEATIKQVKVANSKENTVVTEQAAPKVSLLLNQSDGHTKSDSSSKKNSSDKSVPAQNVAKVEAPVPQEPIIIVTDQRVQTDSNAVKLLDSKPEVLLGQALRDTGNDEIVKRAQFILKSENVGEIKLTLRPEELGTVRISLSMEDNKISGHIIVDSNSAKNAFDENMKDLRDAMLKSGFADATLNVSVGGREQEHREEASEQEKQPFYSNRLKEGSAIFEQRSVMHTVDRLHQASLNIQA